MHTIAVGGHRSEPGRCVFQMRCELLQDVPNSDAVFSEQAFVGTSQSQTLADLLAADSDLIILDAGRIKRKTGGWRALILILPHFCGAWRRANQQPAASGDRGDEKPLDLGMSGHEFDPPRVFLLVGTQGGSLNDPERRKRAALTHEAEMAA